MSEAPARRYTLLTSGQPLLVYCNKCPYKLNVPVVANKCLRCEQSYCHGCYADHMKDDICCNPYHYVCTTHVMSYFRCNACNGWSCNNCNHIMHGTPDTPDTPPTSPELTPFVGVIPFHGKRFKKKER